MEASMFSPMFRLALQALQTHSGLQRSAKFYTKATRLASMLLTFSNHRVYFYFSRDRCLRTAFRHRQGSGTVGVIEGLR